MAIANRTCVSFCTFWPPLGMPWDNRGKCVTWMERGFNACQTHHSMYPYVLEVECRVDAQQLNSTYQGSWSLEEHSLSTWKSASVPPRGGLWAVSLCWQAESDAGDMGSYLLGCGGSGPGERAWWSLVAVSRVGWVYRNADLAPDNFQGTASLRQCTWLLVQYGTILYLSLRWQTSSGL